jgi:hypothetical protein
VFSTEDLEKAKELIMQLMNVNPQSNPPPTQKGSKDNQGFKKKGKDRQENKAQGNQGNGSQTSCFNLLPPELLVIAGVVCGVLKVDSVLVNRNQGVEILLIGSLKRTTQLDKVMQQIGKMPFDQVVKSIVENSSLSDF